MGSVVAPIWLQALMMGILLTAVVSVRELCFDPSGANISPSVFSTRGPGSTLLEREAGYTITFYPPDDCIWDGSYQSATLTLPLGGESLTSSAATERDPTFVFQASEIVSTLEAESIVIPVPTSTDDTLSFSATVQATTTSGVTELVGSFDVKLLDYIVPSTVVLSPKESSARSESDTKSENSALYLYVVGSNFQPSSTCVFAEAATGMVTSYSSLISANNTIYTDVTADYPESTIYVASAVMKCLIPLREAMTLVPRISNNGGYDVLVGNTYVQSVDRTLILEADPHHFIVQSFDRPTITDNSPMTDFFPVVQILSSEGVDASSSGITAIACVSTQLNSTSCVAETEGALTYTCGVSCLDPDLHHSSTAVGGISDDLGIIEFTSFYFNGLQDTTYDIHIFVAINSTDISLLYAEVEDGVDQEVFPNYIEGVTVAECSAIKEGSTKDPSTNECVCSSGYETTVNGCRACDADTYKATIGEGDDDVCVSCPANSFMHPETTGSSDVADCICAENYYRISDPSEGSDCLPCPTGAVCNGARTIPYAAEGFFPSSFEDLVFVTCPQGSDCLEDGECGEGHEGYLCGACVDGWVLYGSECDLCPKAHAVRVLILPFLLLVVSIAFFYAGLRNVRFLKSGSATSRARLPGHGLVIAVVEFLQYTSLMRHVHVGWADAFESFFTLLSVFSFNTSGIYALECVTETSPFTLLHLTLCLPLVVMALLVVIYYFKSLFDIFRSGAGGALLPKFLLKVSGSDPESVAIQQHISGVNRPALTSAFATLAWLSYLPVVDAVFRYFACSRLEDGKWAFDAAPSYLCYEGTHAANAALPSLGLVLYVVGIPAVVFLVLRSKLKSVGEKEFHSPSSATFLRLGTFYGRFKREKWYWCVSIMGQKLAMGVAFAFYTGTPPVQLVLFVVAMLFAVMFTSFADPWGRVRTSHLSQVVLESLFVLLLCAVILLLSPSGSTGSEFGNVMALLVMLAVVVTLFVITYAEKFHFIALQFPQYKFLQNWFPAPGADEMRLDDPYSAGKVDLEMESVAVN